MTAILSMCLDDGAFVATDAGFQTAAEDDERAGRTFEINRHTALSGMGYAPAVHRIGVVLEEEIDEDHTQAEILEITRTAVEDVSERAQRNEPNLDTTFQVVLTGYATEIESGYVAAIDSPDSENPQDEVKTTAGQIHAAGSNVDLLMAVHEEIREGVITYNESISLDVWGSTVISVAAAKDDAIDMPATLVRTTPEGYHEKVADERISKPTVEFDAVVT